MSMSLQLTRTNRIGRRLRGEGGFIMLLTLGVLMVTLLLTAAAFVVVQSDTALTRGDLDGKRAYAAAQAGLQDYLYALNSNASSASWWETCSNDVTSGRLAVPGATTGVLYSYQPVIACNASKLVGTLIDPTTGTLRMEFTGYSGTGCSTSSTPCQQRTIVAGLREVSPLSFLWYTVHETYDPVLLNDPTCANFYRANPGPNAECDIYWGPDDKMNGPMYTQDQYLIYPGAAPTFGRNKQDTIASQVGTTGPNDICAGSNCQGDTNILGTPDPDPSPLVPLPSSNANLLPDAQKYGVVLNGTATLHVNGGIVTGYLCTTSSASSCAAIAPITLASQPIIYATNASACGSYNPQSVNYSSTTIGGTTVYLGGCGDVYVYGAYSAPITIAAADDVIITSSLTNSTDTDGNTAPAGTATLGLVADQYVRVMHPCGGNGVTSPNVTIDGAILTLAGSFFVDNYSCDTAGILTVHGAIAQEYRGAVGTAGTPGNGYSKNYNYDDRLSVMLPPYMFDLQSTEWSVFRETLCSPTAAATNPISCADQS
jgi:Tfp pilus assembly protein PilX